MNLYKQVKESWTSDFISTSNSDQRAASSFRRRSPFVPFALKNDTGSQLKFTTNISDLNVPNKPVVKQSEDNWFVAEPGETIPFSFTSRSKYLLDESISIKHNAYFFVCR